MKTLYLLLLLPLASCAGQIKGDMAETNDGNESVRTLMGTSYYSGSCDMLYSVVNFQESVPMTGSKEFLNAFVAFKAGKAKVTPTEYGNLCQQIKSNNETNRGIFKAVSGTGM